MSPLVLPVLDFARSLIDRWFPDPTKRAEAEIELFRLAQEGDLKVALAQLEVNAREAQSPSLWVAGWRPAVGWACAAGFVYTAIGQPVLVWFASMVGVVAPPPVDADLLLGVLGALLGIGGLRTVEKIRGVAAK